MMYMTHLLDGSGLKAGRSHGGRLLKQKLTDICNPPWWRKLLSSRDIR
uniref:Uncharacterized protein n=1 Tax=Anguilla anguilla TaxID=7936 RepID=A0A0E9T4M6_ANGAN